MAKKQFDTKNATSKFFTDAEQNTQETQKTQEPQEKQDKQENLNPFELEKHPNGKGFPASAGRRGRPRKQEGEGKRGFRYSLLLDADLNQYLHEIVWTKRTNMTQYVNDLIRADYEAYLQDCKEKGKDPFEGWENPNEI